MTAYSETIPASPGFYVYRLWAADGSCLYVGRVGDNGPRPPRARLAHHRRTKPWWSEVARIEVASFAAHPEIVAEEAAQILAQRPMHNKQRAGCSHDLSLPGAVRVASGQCRECENREERTSPRRKALAAARKRKHDEAQRARGLRRLSGSTRASIARRRPSSGQGGLWLSTVSKSLAAVLAAGNKEAGPGGATNAAAGP